jgi:hypothetical protein
MQSHLCTQIIVDEADSLLQPQEAYFASALATVVATGPVFCLSLAYLLVKFAFRDACMPFAKDGSVSTD